MIPIKLNESSASLRVVPLPPLIRASDGTSAATNESGRTFYFSIGGVDYGSGGSLSAISAAMGMYAACFSASKVSVSGPGMVYYGLPNSSLTVLPVSAPFVVSGVDSYDSMRMGLFALPNAAAEAAGGLVTFGTGSGQLHVSSGSVGLKAQTHSQATIQGVTRLNSAVTLNADTHSGATIQGVTRVNSSVTPANGLYSGVTVRLDLQDYSGATVGVNNVAAGSYSGVTIQGVTRVNSSVTPANAVYSGVTVRIDLQDYSGATVGAGNIAPGAYSGVSVEVKAGGIQAGSLGAGTITAAKFGAGAIDAAALATDAGQEIADALLGRNIAGGSDGVRTVSEALYPLRNRVQIEGSTLTVYATDDSTSAWTASVTTGTNPLSGLDPL